MSGKAEVVIIGNLGKDPEMQYLPSGATVTKFSVAAGEKYTKNDGTAVDTTTWYNVAVFGKRAESCSQYLAKGKQVYVRGRLTIRQYAKNDGSQGVSVDVNADDVVFLGSRSDDLGAQAAAAPQRPTPPTAKPLKDSDFSLPGDPDDKDDEDIPF